MQATFPSRIALCLLLLTGLAPAPRGMAQTPGAAFPPPQKVFVSDIVIQGNRRTPAEQIKNQLKTRVGKEFLPEVLQEDVRTLYATREFGNVWAELKDAGPRRVKVFVYLREFASTVQRVVYTGNVTLSQDDLEQITKVRKGTPLNPTANKVACRAVTQRYNEEGRPFAACVLLKGAAPDDAEVVFGITEGPKVAVRAIHFTGNYFVGQAVLKTHISSSAMFLGVLGGTFNAAAADNDVHQLIAYYRSFGYHDVKVNRELDYSGDGRKVTLIFHIQEGVRYRLAGAPHIVGVKSDLGPTLAAISKMKAGEFYDEGKINGDTSRIKDYFGYRGYLVRATAVPVFCANQPGVVEVEYEVKDQ